MVGEVNPVQDTGRANAEAVAEDRLRREYGEE
jgi:hypothetical protein